MRDLFVLISSSQHLTLDGSGGNFVKTFVKERRDFKAVQKGPEVVDNWIQISEKSAFIWYMNQ